MRLRVKWIGILYHIVLHFVQSASIGQLQIENTSITSYLLGCVVRTVPFISSVMASIMNVLDHLKVDLAQRLLILELVDTASAIYE